MADDGILAYFAKFGLDASEFLSGLEKSSGGILKFYRDVSVSLGATMFVFDKLMSYGQQFIQLANQAAEFVSVLDRLSVTTGMTNEELQRFTNVARYADSDISSLAAMVNKLQINLRDQGEQGEKARKVLDAMHVSYKNADGSLRSTAEIFPDVIEGLKGLGSSADKVTAANILVGRGYQELSGYIALGKDGIEDYYNTANTMTTEQQNKLRDYERACKDLDSTLKNINQTVGSELAPSFTEWVDLLNNDVLKQDGAVIKFFDSLDSFLTLTARGFHIMGAEAGAAWKLVHGDIQGAIQDQKDLASWVGAKQTEDAVNAWKRLKGEDTTGGNTSLPPDLGGSSEKEKVLTAEQIVAKQTELARKTIEANRAEREYQELKKKTNDWQSTGVKTQLEFNENLELARLRAVGLKNECSGITAELQKAGVAVAAIAGPTYNSVYKSALNTGGLGPDWAGYSDLANMTADQLQAVIDKAEKGGGSKGMAEKARLYFSMLGSSGKETVSGAATSSSKDLTPGSAEQTTELEMNLSKQANAWTTLNDTIKTGWADLEQAGLVHYTALADLSRIRTQAELDYMTAAVNFAGANPIIQNKVIMSATGPDWNPPTFTAIKAPTLEAADFSSVKFSGSSESKQSNNSKSGSGSGTQVVKVDLTVKDQTDNGIKASQKQGEIAIARGFN